MGVSQNEGYHFGVQIIRTIMFWGLYWGPLILGNYHIEWQVNGCLSVADYRRDGARTGLDFWRDYALAFQLLKHSAATL